MAEFCSTVNILPLFTLIEEKNNNSFVLYTQSDLNNTLSQHNNYAEGNQFKVNLSDISKYINFVNSHNNRGDF